MCLCFDWLTILLSLYQTKNPLITQKAKRQNMIPVGVLVRRSLKILLAAVLILVLNACSSPTPPTEFAPEGEIIQKAILLQLNQAEQRLSQQLNAAHPQIDISQIKVKTLEPIYVAELPAYHLQGTYNLKLTLPHQQVTQKITVLRFTCNDKQKQRHGVYLDEM